MTKTDWISVKEKLPEDYRRVLVYGNAELWCDQKCVMAIFHYNKNTKNEYGRGWHFETASGYEYETELDGRNITHWMPLPPPPDENSDDALSANAENDKHGEM